MNLDDVREILALMRENGLSEFEIEKEGLRLRLRKDVATGAVAALARHWLVLAPGSEGSGEPCLLMGKRGPFTSGESACVNPLTLTGNGPLVRRWDC